MTSLSRRGWGSRHVSRWCRLRQGRERIYLDRIWNDFGGDPGQPDESTREAWAAEYAQPGAMRAGFAQFASFPQDVTDNKAFMRTKLTMPVLAIGGEKSFGATEAVVMRSPTTTFPRFANFT